MYIHERDNWTAFRWNAAELTALLEEVNRKQGLLYGRLASLGFDSKLKAMAENLTFDVVYSSEIEGIRLNVDEVRSSIARKSEIRIEQQNGNQYIKALYKGKLPVSERILPLDAERYEKGYLSLENLLAKYCSYLRMN